MTDMHWTQAHFPINVVISKIFQRDFRNIFSSKDKKQLEVKNFLGGKKAHLIIDRSSLIV